ncbi:ubiquinol-cytochrome-c reductase complex assembly factor 3 [Trichomycterus rosablanca]|uniref:ubiquinol-cytochrome-c reductase complex assembly factor 3 n=1 Tax=Trichomycterus rosablanca TaxID=2290929 RepID=UPI002F352389
MSAARTVMAYTAALAALLAGCASWWSISPGEDRNKQILQKLPESNPDRMEESRKRNAVIMELLKDAAQTNENVARSFGPHK